MGSFNLKKITICLVILYLPLLLFSHENSEFEFLGFSSQGKYCAFEVYGYGDPDPAVYSYIYIIDVKKNEFAHTPYKIEKNQDNFTGIMDVRSENLNKALTTIEKLEIQPTNKGTLVFYNLRINEPKQEQNWSIFNDAYKLELIKHINKEDLILLELNLYFGNKKIILQKDSGLPGYRKNAKNYRLLAGYYYYGALAVFIEYDIYGWEGYNRRQMLVTGIIKTKELPMQYD